MRRDTLRVAQIAPLYESVPPALAQRMAEDSVRLYRALLGERAARGAA